MAAMGPTWSDPTATALDDRIVALRRAICSAARPPQRDPVEAARIKVELSILCAGSGRRLQARRLIEGAIATLSRQPDAEPALARALNALGTLSSGEARHREAEAAFAEAVRLMEAHGSIGADDLALGWRNLGIARSALHRPEQAVQCLQKALSLPADPAERNRARLSLANAFCSLSRYGSAAALYETVRREADAGLLPRVLSSLALLRERSGEVAAAKFLYEQAIAAARRLGADRDSLPTVLINASHLMLSLGDVAYAQLLLRRARRWARADGGTKLQFVYAAAWLALAAGRPGLARRRFERAAMLAETMAGPTSPALLAIRHAALDLRWATDQPGAYAELAAALDACRADPGDPQPALVRAALGVMALELGRIKEAADLARVSLLDEVAMGVAELRWRVLMLLARTAAARDRRRAATLLGKMAVGELCRLGADYAVAGGSGPGYRQERSPAFQDLADWLATIGRVPEACEIHRIGLADEMFDLVRRDEDRRPRLAPMPLSVAEDALARRFASVAGVIGQDAETSLPVDGRAGRLGAWLDDVFAETWWRPEPSRIDRAPDDSADLGVGVLRYIQHRDGFRLVTTVGALSMTVELPATADELGRLCFRLRTGLLARSPDVVSVAHQLHTRLIAPAAAMLAGLRELRIVPDGVIRYVPFALLSDGARFLIEYHAISLAGITSVPSGERRSRRHWPAVGFGGGKLAHVPRELAGGVGRLGGLVLLDDQFTRDALLGSIQAEAALLHVASHFTVEQGRAGRSRLLLGDGSTMLLDEFRTPDLDLSQLELLILSACDTGLEVDGEQGLSSLAGLFIQLGARSVLGTLWPVDDAAAADLMLGFYEEAFLRPEDDPVSLAEALRRAQLRLIAMARAGGIERGGLGGTSALLAHPYYWAGYVLFGDPA